MGNDVTVFVNAALHLIRFLQINILLYVATVPLIKFITFCLLKLISVAENRCWRAKCKRNVMFHLQHGQLISRGLKCELNITLLLSPLLRRSSNYFLG